MDINAKQVAVKVLRGGSTNNLNFMNKLKEVSLENFEKFCLVSEFYILSFTVENQ